MKSKSIILSLILLCSLKCFSQQNGKLVRNSSVLAMTVQMDTLPLWMVSITNKASCRSLIEFKVDDGKVDTVTLAYDEDQQMMIHGDFVLFFRNAAKCDSVNNKWMILDNTIFADFIPIPKNPTNEDVYLNSNPSGYIPPLLKGTILRGSLRREYYIPPN